MTRHLPKTITAILITLATIAVAGQTITIDTNKIIHNNFGGLGFGWDGWSVPVTKSMFTEGEKFEVSDKDFEKIFVKRWMELNPGMLRCQFGPGWFMPEAGKVTPDSPYMLSLYRILSTAKKNGAKVYLSDWAWEGYQPKWLTGGKLDFSNLDHKLWAKVHVDALEYLINIKDYKNIKWWGNTNEMQDRSEDSKISFDELKSVMTEFKAELASRKLTSLVNTMVSDQSWWYKYDEWSSIDWATKNMDEICDLYGGHFYANERNYERNKLILGKGVKHAKSKNKNFLLGEFGDQKMDRSGPDYGRRLCEVAVAGINAGCYAMCSWVLADAPYDYGSCYVDWGLFKDKNSGYAIKPAYYAYGLMTKYFRPGSTIYDTVGESESDGIIGTCAKDKNGRWTIALVNNGQADSMAEINFEGSAPTLELRRYIYNPKRIPADNTGNLQASSGTVKINAGSAQILIPASSVIVLTNNPDLTGQDKINTEK